MFVLTTYLATYIFNRLGRVRERGIGRLIGPFPDVLAAMEKTKVVVAQPKSRSLRTTIPAGIARTLGITEGSELGWDLQAKENQLVLIVRVLGTDNQRRDSDRVRRKVNRG